jgi:serralysin
MKMGHYFIDALRNEAELPQGYRGFANARDGQGVVLGYSFLTKVPNGAFTSYGDPNNGFQAYTSAEKTVVNRALAQIEAVADIRFKETSGNKSDLQFGQFDMSPNVAGAGRPLIYDKANKETLRGPNHSVVWLDVEYVETHVVLHEVGHALGFKHPFGGSVVLPTDENNLSNTVMSYTGTWGNKLEIYDIIALQSIYGPAKRRMGNDSYEFGDDKLIWDGGGRDEITAAMATASVTIDLRDGSWNHIGPKAESFLNDQQGTQVYLGNFTVIENLTGSNYDDGLSGNKIANRIAGRQGDDRLAGGAGGDWLQGGSGSDDFVLVTLRDSTVAKSGRDHIDDFRHDEADRFDLESLDANAKAAGNQAFTFIGGLAFSKSVGEIRFQDSGKNTLVSGDVTGDGKADFAFLLRGDIQLMEDDFVL